MSVDDSAIPSDIERDPVEQLAEDFLRRRRQGEAVSVSEYADQHPQWAARIRDLFPTLLLMEELKPGPTSSPAADMAAMSRPEPTPERLGDFRILREIGRGGMGVVYEAEQESLGRRVALKVLPAGSIASPTRLQRFLREAQAAARLHHTNIVPVFGVGQQDGVSYYVMQYIAGRGLDQVLGALRLGNDSPMTIPWGEEADRTEAPDRPREAWSSSEAVRMLLAAASGTPDPSASGNSAAPATAMRGEAIAPGGPRYWRSVARIGIQVSDALAYAHRQGTLHRDIKPANLLLDFSGTVWIADFGLAKLADFDDLTHSGEMVGTLRYMAPEQFSGKADPRSDVYSLGLTLYELLTLRPAFGEKDHRQLIRQVIHEEPPRPRKLNPAIPRDLETIVVKAIDSHPEHRYQTAGELASDLRCFLEDRPIRARRITVLGALWRWCKRNRAVAALTGTAAMLLVAVAVVASVGYLRTNQALQRVSEEREQADAARRQAELQRARTMAEHERAEANLRLAMKAFEDVFAKVASDTFAQPAPQDDEEEWPELTGQVVVTDKDAALLESMLKFYDQFAEQNDSNLKLRRETARAYRRVGDIQRRLGQYEKAETAYRRALATYQHLTEADRDDADGVTAVAAIDNELGVTLRMAGRYSDARTAHLQAQETLRGESSKVAGLPESRFELARSYSFLSMLPLGPPGGGPPGGGPPPGARPGASALLDKVPPGSGMPGKSVGGQAGPPGAHAANPMAPGALSSGSGPPGGLRGLRGMFGRGREAIEHNRKALEIFQQLSSEYPDNPRYRLATARTQRERCLLAAFVEPKEEIDKSRSEAIRILDELIAAVPQNPEYRYELVETLAMPYPRSSDGKGSNSDGQLRRAIEIGGDLVIHYPTVPEYRVSLARVHAMVAETSRAAGSLTAAEEHMVKAVALQEGLVADFPAMLSYRFFLARSLHQLGEIQTAEHEPAKARASFEAAIATSKKVQESATGVGPARMMLGAQYSLLTKVLKVLGETKLAAEAAAKAAEFGERHGPPGFSPRRPFDREGPGKPEHRRAPPPRGSPPLPPASKQQL